MIYIPTKKNGDFPFDRKIVDGRTPAPVLTGGKHPMIGFQASELGGAVRFAGSSTVFLWVKQRHKPPHVWCLYHL